MYITDTLKGGEDKHYVWSTSWAADGTLIDGVEQADFRDVIYATTGNDKIDGKGGNDALDGGAGNDEIDGGDGDDVIAGGEGSDTIKGGAGNDTILSAASLNAPERKDPNDGWNPTMANSGGPITEDDAPDVIDAGDGNDIVYAGRGDDRIEGGAGDDSQAVAMKSIAGCAYPQSATGRFVAQEWACRRARKVQSASQPQRICVHSARAARLKGLGKRMNSAQLVSVSK